MSWARDEYDRGYKSFLDGMCRHSWESVAWLHGWNDASLHANAKMAIARAKGEKV